MFWGLCLLSLCLIVKLKTVQPLWKTVWIRSRACIDHQRSLSKTWIIPLVMKGMRVHRVLAVLGHSGTRLHITREPMIWFQLFAVLKCKCFCAHVVFLPSFTRVNALNLVPDKDSCDSSTMHEGLYKNSSFMHSQLYINVWDDLDTAVTSTTNNCNLLHSSPM